MKFEGIIFDLDGTLLDSMHIWDNLASEYLSFCGIAAEDSLNSAVSMMTLAESAEYMKREYGLSGTEREIAEGVNALIVHKYRSELRLKPYAENLLKNLYKRGIKMCIATATDKAMARAALRNNGVLEYFADIITCTETGTGKTSPDVYETALSLLGTEKSVTLVAEDALFAVKTAMKAGFSVLAIYDKYETNQEELRQISDLYAEDWQKAEKLIV